MAREGRAGKDQRILVEIPLVKAKEDSWEKGFTALCRFKAREGHCRTSRFHVEARHKLGPWVSNQRYYRNNLTTERRQRLDAIGFIWNWREYLWEEGYSALLKFRAREGHCQVPSSHVEENYKLGYWVSTQRRKKSRMPTERKARLNKLGFVWSAKKR